MRLFSAAFITTTLLLLFVSTLHENNYSQSQHSGEIKGERVILVTGATLRVDGTWTERDFYVENGLISWNHEQSVTDTLNAGGMFITPGFADAHTHNLDRSWQRGYVDRYLSEGTLVVQNLTSKSKGAREFKSFMDGRPSPKVRYSNWGFTSTLGHPFMAYEPYAMGLNDPATWSSNADSIRESRMDLKNSYVFVDRVSQLETVWPEFMETNPDLVKIYYFNEEEIDEQKPGNHGLRRDVAKAIIDRAHREGLRVFAHVSTRSDFEKMLKDGVDGFAHMPGYSWNGDQDSYDRFFLPDSLLKIAADKETVIIPTATLNQFYNRNDSTAMERTAQFQTDLIRRYRQMGGTIATGSDIFGQTGEIMYRYYAEWIDLPPGDKLDLLTSETTGAVLPKTNTGRIEEGFEASFLIFDEKPFENNRWTQPKMVFLEGEKVAERIEEEN